MKSVELIIVNLPPLPLNRAKMLVANPRPMYIKTPLAREFEKDLTDRLLRYSDQFEGMRKFFDPKLHYMSMEFTAFCPSEEMYTKEGHISSRCPDFDSNKLMIDVIFNSMGLNDKLVKDATIKYVESPDHYWNFKILFKLEKICRSKNTSISILSTTTQETNDLL